MNKFQLRGAARSAAALMLLAGLAQAVAFNTAVAQDLPLVSRELQFHATPAERGAAAEGGAGSVSSVPVDLTNLPRVPLPAGATILPPQIDPQTGLYVSAAGERGPAGQRGVVLPETPAQQPEEVMPRLTAGQTYLPPWFDEVRNVLGGRGPADRVPESPGVRPDDLRITPVPAPEGGASDGLPDEPPAAPLQRSAAPPPAVVPAPAPAPAVQAAPAAVAQPAPPTAPLQPAAAPRASTPAASNSPIPLVSRKLNFQY